MRELVLAEWRARRRFIITALVLLAVGRLLSVIFRDAHEVFALVLNVYVLPFFFLLYLGTVPFTAAAGRRGRAAPAVAGPPDHYFHRRFLTGLVLYLCLLLLALTLLIVAAPERHPGLDPFLNQAWQAAWFLVPIQVLLYAAAALTALSTKKITLTLFLVPILLLLAVLLALPFFVVLLLLVSLGKPWFFLCFAAVLFLLVFAGRLAWRRVVLEHKPCRNQLAVVAAAFLAFSLAAHGLAWLATGLQLEGALRQARAVGFPSTFAEIIPPRVPPEENAAPVYQQAFKAAEPLREMIYREWLPQPFFGLEPADDPAGERLSAAAGLIASQELSEVYALVDEAVMMPACRFEIAYEGPTALLPHLGPLRLLARLVALRTSVLARRGRYEAALVSARTGFRLAAVPAAEPLLISRMVGFALAEIAADACRGFLAAPPDTVPPVIYRDILRTVDSIDLSLERGVHGELFMTLETCPWQVIFSDVLEYRQERRGNARFNRLDPRPRLLPWLVAPVWRRALVFHAREMVLFAGFAGQPRYAVGEELAAWENAPSPWYQPYYVYHWFSLIFITDCSFFSENPYGRILTRQADCRARLDSLRLALALKIHREERGRYPDALAPFAPGILPDLPLDPFTGENFVYRREGRGFTVYSVGPNFRDDSGLLDWEKKLDDISWTVKR